MHGRAANIEAVKGMVHYWLFDEPHLLSNPGKGCVVSRWHSSRAPSRTHHITRPNY